MKNDLLRSYYLRFDWSGWIALIKSKIFITTGITWPISSVKWKAPQLAARFGSFPWHLARLDIPLYLSGAWDWVSHTVWSSKGYSLLRTQKNRFLNAINRIYSRIPSTRERKPYLTGSEILRYALTVFKSNKFSTSLQTEKYRPSRFTDTNKENVKKCIQLQTD